MGPTNVALVKLLKADLALREAQGHLASASRNMTVQAKRIAEHTEKLKAAQAGVKEQQAKSANIELDIKTRDERIERLRTQQSAAINNREYQAFLTEINTEKIDKGKSEEELMKVMEAVEKSQAEIAEIDKQLAEAQTAHESTKQQIGGKLTELQAEVDKLVPRRAAAAAAVPPAALQEFERLADRYDGEAITPISKPNRRREEYICTACNRDLVVDIYNRLHTRNDLVKCPTCHRLLYIPEDLPPEEAIGSGRPEPKAASPKAPKAPGAKKPPKRKASAVAAADAARPEGSDSTKPPLVLEQRAKGKLGELFAAAQAESVSRCVASDSKPIDFEVWTGGELSGIYKGQTRDHLERVIKFLIGEAGLTNDVEVREHAAHPHPSHDSTAGTADHAPTHPASESPAEPVPVTHPQHAETSATSNH